MGPGGRKLTEAEERAADFKAALAQAAAWRRANASVGLGSMDAGSLHMNGGCGGGGGDDDDDDEEKGPPPPPPLPPGGFPGERAASAGPASAAASEGQREEGRRLGNLLDAMVAGERLAVGPPARLPPAASWAESESAIVRRQEMARKKVS